MLAPPDREYLEDLGLAFDVSTESGLISVVVHDWPLPAGLEPRAVDLLLRLPAAFPDAQPDMYWCDPPVRIASSGQFPQNADLMEEHLGRTWQRFSRHLPPGAWRPGQDNLASYLALIRRALAREVGSQA